MKDELTSFETAKLAKEKEFSQKHIDNGGYYKFREDHPNEPFYIAYYKVLRSCMDMYTCKAPTQSLLQRWLREKHKIHISVEPKWTISFRGILYYFVVKVYTGRYQDIKYSIRKYKTHEEGLEIGLFEALKLIE